MSVPRTVSCRRLYRAGMYMLATRVERAVLTNWAMKSLSVRLLFSALTVWCLFIKQTAPGLIGQLSASSHWTIGQWLDSSHWTIGQSADSTKL